ncbi:MAG TPA: bifunctional phosphopantothenoylcysteine decarboxylase/phosphopantothenate--cysteine ligase CoaBC [Egibacteraceae bacterium]|nr:bifunctional phosphopantothenoylcysteine decarboxylase/phosphopantothenate--cysteine ligase CoaBC [Egibacteraceae bacterium]
MDADGRQGVLAGRHVLLGVSGGIAAYKAAALARALVRAGATVQPVLTAGAAEFVGPATFEGLTGRPAYTGVFTDAHRILHVRLAREADVAVFAPATANLLAKFSLGLADDLVSSVFACLTCPVVVAPAMHTEMWLHPATQANAEVLRVRGARLVGPAEGELAGGDSGPGRLADVDDILAAVVAALRPPAGPLSGRGVLVTAGGTREPLDPVRFIGNRSSGKMGYRLAEEAARRGAVVDLVAGPTALADPPGVTVHHVETAEEMREAVLRLVDKADVVLKAAAVADFRPVTRAAEKVKKESERLLTVRLERTPDILAELGREGSGKVLVGFAAETALAEEHGREKLHRKGLDLIVVNRVDASDAGFDVDTNRALLLSADGERTEVPLTTKAQLAALICDRVQALLAGRSD